jgi:hypothetical protein
MESLIGLSISFFLGVLQFEISRGSKIDDGEWRLSIFDPPSSILELNRLPLAPAAQYFSVELFGAIQVIDGYAHA